jgi:hypothetical protein
MLEPLKTSSIAIGNLDNTISLHADGSMLLKDVYVEVKLKDLIGGTVVLNPAIVVSIEAADWDYNPSEKLYWLEIPHNFNLIDAAKTALGVVTMNVAYEKIGIDLIISLTNSVIIKITEPLDIYVALKKL